MDKGQGTLSVERTSKASPPASGFVDVTFDRETKTSMLFIYIAIKHTSSSLYVMMHMCVLYGYFAVFLKLIIWYLKHYNLNVVCPLFSIICAPLESGT